MSNPDEYTKGGGPAASSLPQPPSREQMPLCARCLREGGITLYGGWHAPEKAAIHPKHVAVYRGKGERVEGFVHRGPREALCGFHVELVAWEGAGKSKGYPPPPWTLAGRGRTDVDRVMGNLDRALTSPTKGMRPPTTQRTPTEQGEASTRAVARERIDREPGEEG